jgi:hypothetical protein
MKRWAFFSGRDAAALLVATSLSCDSVAPEPEPQPLVPPITIELQNQLEVIPGQTGPGPTYSTTHPLPFVIRRNGYTGAVALSAEVLPAAGMSSPVSAAPFFPELGPTQDIPGSIQIHAPAGTSVGTHLVKLRATAGNLGSVEDTASVSVIAFSMVLARTSVKVSAGATNTLSAYFTRDGTRPLTVSTSAPPPGISVAVVPNGNTTYLDISAAAGTSPAVHALTVTATSGSVQTSREIQVVVVAPQPRRRVSFRLCRNQTGGFRASALTTGYQYANEGESWMPVTADASGVISFDATERVSIAERFYYPLGEYAPGSGTRVLHLTATELETMQCAPARIGSKTFPVRVDDAAKFFIELGAFQAASATSFLGGALAGPHDLIASATRTVATGSEFRAIVRRAQDLANRDTIVLDFAGPESAQLDSSTLALDGQPAAAVTYVHTPTTVARLGGLTLPQSGNQYWALPESMLQAGDIQSVSAGTATRGAMRYFRSVSPLALSLGPELSTPVLDVEAQTITLPVQAEYSQLAGAGHLYVVDFRGVYNYVEVWQSKNFLGGTPAQAWVFTLPDFGRQAGIGPFRAGALLGGMATDGSPALMFGGIAAAGESFRWARQDPTRFGWYLPFPSGR